jgi:hypothetical protein
MTKFNPENKETLTYGECLDPAMKITEAEDAQQYLADYVDYIQLALNKEPRDDGKTAAEIAGINLGYYAGYYDHETRERVERLFNCTHPIFGDAATHQPTAEESLNAGLAMGREV